jgi:hypothetical protein
MYYGDGYKEREHLKYVVVDKGIILKLSSLGYGKCEVNRQAERGGKKYRCNSTHIRTPVPGKGG